MTDCITLPLALRHPRPASWWWKLLLGLCHCLTRVDEPQGSRRCLGAPVAVVQNFLKETTLYYQFVTLKTLGGASFAC
jgi:hypothetical protein